MKASHIVGLTLIGLFALVGLGKCYRDATRLPGVVGRAAIETMLDGARVRGVVPSVAEQVLRFDPPTVVVKPAPVERSPSRIERRTRPRKVQKKTVIRRDVTVHRRKVDNTPAWMERRDMQRARERARRAS
jgi:hypothetical protein